MPKPFKRNRPVRKRSWDVNDWDTASREGRSKRADALSLPERAPSDFFSECAPNGLVVSPYGVLAFVLCDGAEYLCRIDDALVDGKSSVLAPGDKVLVEHDERGPVVHAVHRRANKLSRPSVGREREQVFAANIDCVVIVASVARPAFNPGLIDRYLVAAQAGGVSAAVCVNKIDMCDTEPPGVRLYRDLGLKVLMTSCSSGEGLDAMRAELDECTSVLVGHSGVGKSSLVNALDPNMTIHTQEISDSTNKGRHTTSASRLYELAGGIRIIDTPGVKQLGLWGVSPAELDYYFHELAAVAPQCRFRDCTHTHEPHCAVREAVETGTVARARYDSYLRIRASLAEDPKR